MVLLGRYYYTFASLIVIGLITGYFPHASAQAKEFLITSYGAQCNGVSDDSVAIRAAIAAAGKVGGGTVRFPDNKTCVIAKEIKVSSNNIKLEGAGDGRRDSSGTGEATQALDYTNGGNKVNQSRIIVNTAIKSRMDSNHPLYNIPSPGIAFEISGDNFAVRNLRFVGPRIWYKDGKDPAHDGKIFTARKKIVIEDTTFDGVGYATIRGGQDTQLTFVRNICVNWGRTCVGNNKNTVIKDNVFRQTTLDWSGKNSNQPTAKRWSEYASYVYAVSGSGVYNYTFTNNIVEGAYAGVHVNGGAQGYRPSGFTITNNTFRKNYLSIVGSDFGGGGRWENVTIANNLFEDDVRTSMYIYKGEKMTIENNLVRRTSAAAMEEIPSGLKLKAHQDDTDVGRVVVSNNTFDAFGTPNWSAFTIEEGGGYRLSLLPTKVYDITIKNNKFLNQGNTKFGAGVYLRSSDQGRQSKIAVTCNTFTSTDAAGVADINAYVRIGGNNAGQSSYVTDFTVKNNTFTGNGRDKLYGVLTQNASKVTNGAITNNVFTKFADARRVSVAQQGVTLSYDAPNETCNAGVLAGITPGATFGSVQPTETTPPVLSSPVAAPTAESPKAAAVSLTKIVDKSVARPGEELVYTITIKNTGSGSAKNLVLTDVLHSDLRFVSATDNATFSNGLVTWRLAELAANATKEIKLNVTVR